MSYFFNQVVVYYNFCLDEELSSELCSLCLVTRDFKIVIFSNLCEFIYSCLETISRFLKHYLIVSIKVCVDKSIIHLHPWIVLVFHV